MSGHIRRRGSQSWELKFDTGRDPSTGKRLTKYRAFKGTKAEAKAELVRLINSTHQGDYVDPSKTTLGEFLDRWLRDWATINVGAKTRERYQELVTAHIQPYIGAVPIQKLQPVHLAELYARLLREGNRQRGLNVVTGLAPHSRSRAPRASQGAQGRSRMGCHPAQCCRSSETAEVGPQGIGDSLSREGGDAATKTQGATALPYRGAGTRYWHAARRTAGFALARHRS